MTKVDETGLGAAFQNTLTNSFMLSLPNASHKLSYLHAMYGIGGLAGPIVATAFVSSGIRFSYFFAVSLGIAGLACVILLLAFCLRATESSDVQLDGKKGEAVFASLLKSTVL